MPDKLPKARRAGASNQRIALVLVAIVVVLLGAIGYLLSESTLFDTAPKSDAERDYEILVDAVAEDPENAAILMTLAETEYLLGRREDALGNAAKAVELAGEQAGIRVCYATILVQEGLLEEASQQLEAEMDLGEGKDPEPYFLLAQIQMQQGDQDAGLQTMRKALAIEPTAADMRATYAAMLEEAGRKEDAIVQYQEALRFLPGNADIIAALERLGVTVEETATADPHGSASPEDGSGQ